MAVKTRSSSSSSPVKSNPSPKLLTPSSQEEPYQIFVLPSNTSEDARFVLLKSPRDGTKCRYFFCPSRGIFEVTKINAAAQDLRSIMFAPSHGIITGKPGGAEDKLDTATSISNSMADVNATNLVDSSYEGYVNKSAEMFVATPFDPIFILLPLVDRPASTSKIQPGKGFFQPFDDLIEEQLNDDSHLRHVLTNTMFRPTLLKAMHQICDTVEAGGEVLYRLRMHKLYDCILKKAQRVVEKGLPATLEDRFVSRCLEAPILSAKREEITASSTVETNDAMSDCPIPVASQSQSSTASSINTVAVSEPSSATSVGSADCAPATSLRYLQRLRTAISFISASYLDPSLSDRLEAVSCDNKASPDFAPLDEHLEQLAKLRAETLATRSLSDFSKKRNLEDDEADEERAEKRRKQEEEDKRRKSQESRGVRELKKVNVSGMKKMSEFFAKRAPMAKPVS